MFPDDDNSDGNPFKVPADQDIFMLRDKERQRKKEVGLDNYYEIVCVSQCSATDMLQHTKLY